MKIGRRIRKECCLPPIVFNLYSECFVKGALGFGDLNITGQTIRTGNWKGYVVKHNYVN